MGRPNNNRDARPTIDCDFDAIIGEDNVDALVKAAHAIGKAIAGRVTSSQIRGIFATVRQIQLKWVESGSETTQREVYRQAMMLKPQIHYAAARNGDRIAPLDEYLVGALNKVGEGNPDPKVRRERFMRFVDFFEAIVAYHKYEGGR